MQVALDGERVAGCRAHVCANNAPAIALCRKYGFTGAGVLRDWRRLDGVSWDAVLMENFLR
jgi:RimJ/RimL family protein N-acetyltransferase